MALIADILLGAGALGAALYCIVLSRRLHRLTHLESGMGGAIAVLSAQVDDMTKALDRAQAAARSSVTRLESQTLRAEQVSDRLDLVLASMHDLPDPRPASVPPSIVRPAPDVARGGRKLRMVRRRVNRAELEAAE